MAPEQICRSAHRLTIARDSYGWGHLEIGARVWVEHRRGVKNCGESYHKKMRTP